MNKNLIKNYRESLISIAKINFLGNDFLEKKEILISELSECLLLDINIFDKSSDSLAILDQTLFFDNIHQKSLIMEKVNKHLLHIYYYYGEVYLNKNNRVWKVLDIEEKLFCPLLVDNKGNVDTRFLFLIITEIENIHKYSSTCMCCSFRSSNKDIKSIKYWNEYFI